ncbi:uncharacterized protein MONBRDRAFT_34691 [Monosiga brevicollis MX1]|uniref:Pirin N-terminal domain-containing protein n=1 Tax=Monosiga brevicollis TaxID=81824 RepID=A9VDD7_MONBE|nr:uncharacterized protein MONBRDRAFT_34691 [Monosiga brevicollis MX1]EDQ84431.1 predicted protein [Monosiga brevicollis MX1]|eukprot:XP_001750726.1 hypothetical protein [Monosiga brevicollis MX1]
MRAESCLVLLACICLLGRASSAAAPAADACVADSARGCATSELPASSPASAHPYATMALLRKVPADSLFVSEPDPSWFGNGPNPSSNPHWTNKNWLKSRFHFSFAEYHDRARSQFGVLRVMNDDLVQPVRGFGTHPHANMEICTYIVSGDLTHQDSMGTRETLGPRGIQFMTAGTGVRHSEFNTDDTHPLRFIQMWMVPRSRNLEPNYGSMVGDRERQHNKWAHLVADVKNTSADTPVKINQDANIWVTELDEGKESTFELREGRQAYILCLEGATTLTAASAASGTSAQEKLVAHDATQAFGAATLTFAATGSEGVHVLMVEMAAAPL